MLPEAAAAAAAAVEPMECDVLEADKPYYFDEALEAELAARRPWEKDANYFQRCQISALATMKMMKHALSGVEAGTQRGSKPLEIMGLLLGKATENTIVVMDCFPLPVEGTESRVVADDEAVVAHMVNLSERLQMTRQERFIGWYHSHPFDVGTHSHCFLSSTDISTQWAWQRTLTPKWIAIVLDPLRSLAKQRPELGAFRCYPPLHKQPADQVPDGTIVVDETQRQVRWGKKFNRYYEMKVENFMSAPGRNALDILSRNHLWTKILSSSSIHETENRERIADRVVQICTKMQEADISGSTYAQLSRPTNTAPDSLSAASQAASELALEHCTCHASQLMKALLFNQRLSVEQ